MSRRSENRSCCCFTAESLSCPKRNERSTFSNAAHETDQKLMYLVWELTWPESHADALQESLRGVNAGLDAFRRRQVSLKQGSDVSFREVHVVL